MRGHRAGRWGKRWTRGESSVWSRAFRCTRMGPLPCPAPEPNPPSVSHSGFASFWPLRRIPFAPPSWQTLGSPFAGRDGAVVALSALDLSCQGEVWGRISGAGAPGGRCWPGEGTAAPCRFLNAYWFRCQHRALPQP
jgi:hypothetical protein